MAWEENPRICLHMQLIAILSRIGVLIQIKSTYNKQKILTKHSVNKPVDTLEIGSLILVYSRHSVYTGYKPFVSQFSQDGIGFLFIYQFNVTSTEIPLNTLLHYRFLYIIFAIDRSFYYGISYYTIIKFHMILTASNNIQEVNSLQAHRAQYVFNGFFSGSFILKGDTLYMYKYNVLNYEIGATLHRQSIRLAKSQITIFI